MDKLDVKAKKCRLRFSLRALFAAITIVAICFGLWEATKHRGVMDVKNYLAQQESWVEDEDIFVIAPMIIQAGETSAAVGSDADPLAGSTGSLVWEEHYYLWIFGYVIEL